MHARGKCLLYILFHNLQCLQFLKIINMKICDQEYSFSINVLFRPKFPVKNHPACLIHPHAPDWILELASALLFLLPAAPRPCFLPWPPCLLCVLLAAAFVSNPLLWAPGLGPPFYPPTTSQCCTHLGPRSSSCLMLTPPTLHKAAPALSWLFTLTFHLACPHYL